MNWEILRLLILEIISQVLEEEEEITREFSEELLKKLEEEEDTNIPLMQFGTSLTRKVYEAITKVVEISSEMTGKDLTSVIEEVVNEIYPDGLKLSERLWKWDSETRQAIAQIIANGIKSKKTAQSLAYEIESYLHLSGSLQDSLRLKYLDEIKKALSLNIKTPEDRKRLEKLIKKLEKTLNKLNEARYAERKSLIKELRKALERESNEIMKRAIETYLKKETLGRIQRITITEMANAFHKVQIKATYGDPHLVGYRWRLSRAHPRPDICDVYASVNFGLGKGVWPKEKVPKRKPHPHCLCYLLPVYSTKKKQVKERPEYNLKPLINQHKYLKALDELGYPVHKIIDLDPETGKYLREKDFLEKLKIDKEDWKKIKKALTDKKLKELGKILGIGAKSLYREGDLIKHPLREEYTRVVKVIEDFLGNERVLTEMTIQHVVNRANRERRWRKTFREWGIQNLEKILKFPDAILLDKLRKAYIYVKKHRDKYVGVVIGKETQDYIYTIEPIADIKKERYISIYERGHSKS